MRTKLILLLIFSSLTSLLYSQSITNENMQGLWYMIDNETQKFDSIYNLRYDSIIFIDNWRNQLTEIPERKQKTYSVQQMLLQEITVLTGGFGAKYGGEEPLEVFEVKDNEVIFYSNIYESGLVYHYEEIIDLKKKYGEKYIGSQDDKMISTEYYIDGNTLSFAQYHSDSWTQNEILYYGNDTLIVRNPTRNDYYVYVRKQIDTTIDYKIKKIISRRFRSTIEINDNGDINFAFKNSGFYVKKPVEIEDGNYSFKISTQDLEEILHLLKYKNIRTGKKSFNIGSTHQSPYYMTFILENGEEIEYKFHYCNGPPELRIIESKINSLVKDLSRKKFLFIPTNR